MRLPRPIAAFRWFLATVVMLVTAWLLAVHVALWSGLVERLVSGKHKTSEIHLKHGFAWCLVPTVVHFEDLQLEMDGQTYQLKVEAPEGTLDLELGALVSREFHAKHLEVEDASFFLVLKRPETAERRALLPLFPEIDEFGPPFARPKVPPSPKPWVAHLPSFHGTLTEVWIGPYRVSGPLEAAGSILVGAGDSTTFGPILASGQRTRVDIGEHTLASGFDFAGVFDYEPVRRSTPKRRSALTVWGRAQGEIEDLRAINAVVGSKTRMPVAGRGRIAVVGGFAQDRVLGGTRVDLSLEPIHIRRGKLRLKAQHATTQLIAPRSGRLTLVAEVGDAKLMADGVGSMGGLKRFEFGAGWTRVRLDGHLEPAPMRAEVTGLALKGPEVARVFDLPFTISEGRVELDARANRSDANTEFAVDLQSTTIEIEDSKGRTLRGAVEVEVEGTAANRRDFEVEVQSLLARELRIRIPHTVSTPRMELKGSASRQGAQTRFELRLARSRLSVAQHGGAFRATADLIADLHGTVRDKDAFEFRTRRLEARGVDLETARGRSNTKFFEAERLRLGQGPAWDRRQWQDLDDSTLLSTRHRCVRDRRGSGGPARL